MVVGLTSLGSVGHFSDYYTNANYLAMAPILAPLSSPISPGYTPYNELTPSQSTFITNKAKNADFITRFGEENVDWSRDPATLAKDTNAMVYMGLYPGLTMTQLKQIWVVPANKHWQNVTPRYTPLEIGNTIGDASNPFNPDRPSTVHGAVNFQYLIPRHPQYVLPQLYYSAADGATLAGPITTINQYVNQSIAEFTIGTRDINSDAAWNTYLRELESMGLAEWIRLAQATYNRQK